MNSWKEIAVYLNRGVRTVQRWERELQLPVHRIGNGKRSPVYAVVSEVKFWMVSLGGRRALGQSPGPQKINSAPSGNHLGQLTARLYQLAQTVAENSVRHQRQADELKKQIALLKSRVARRPR